MAAPRGFNGTPMAQLAIETEHHGVVTIVPGPSGLRLRIGAGKGAGKGNRTLMTNLEGCDWTLPDQRSCRPSARGWSHE
jgi:hypothetical protein